MADIKITPAQIDPDPSGIIHVVETTYPRLFSDEELHDISFTAGKILDHIVVIHADGTSTIRRYTEDDARLDREDDDRFRWKRTWYLCSKCGAKKFLGLFHRGTCEGVSQ